MKNSEKIIKGVENYYTQKIKQHGNSSLGVDWNSRESQYLRFEQLCKVINESDTYSILDYGCGTGELINYLLNHFKNFKYNGYDISQEMVNQALQNFAQYKNVSFITSQPKQGADYTIASGIFNVKLDLANDEIWLNYLLETLHIINRLSFKGFSFNALTKYSDKEFMKDYLYYADPLFLFDYCKRNISNDVALFHDYKLYEFTIIVRK